MEEDDSDFSQEVQEEDGTALLHSLGHDDFRRRLVEHFSIQF